MLPSTGTVVCDNDMNILGMPVSVPLSLYPYIVYPQVPWSISVFSYMVLLRTIRASGYMIMIMIMTKCSGVIYSCSIFCGCLWLQNVQS
jgi:hypothetical protein